MTWDAIEKYVVVVLAAGLALLGAAFWQRRSSRADKAKTLAEANALLSQRVTDLEGKLALVDQAVVPISAAMQALLIKELTHFHTPEMDELMARVGPPNTLSEAEQERLALMLRERAENMGPEISASERDAALILPAIMRRAAAEAVQPIVATVVGVPESGAAVEAN